MYSMTYLILRRTTKKLLPSRSLTLFRIASLLFLICIGNASIASQEYRVIEKDGKQGLATSSGEELIPPIYDQIGWSNGEFSLLYGKVGYRLKGRWGLINERNKILTPPDFYQLQPFDSNHLLVSLKGTFSNRLFTGLLNREGDIVISLNYFSIEKAIAGYLVTSYYNGLISKGYFDDKYNLIISPEYRDLRFINGLVAAQSFDYKWSFFSGTEKSVTEYDHFQVTKYGIIVEKNGKKGVLALDLKEEIIPVIFKNVERVGSKFVTEEFPTWHITDLELDSTRVKVGDSLLLSDEVFLTYLNGNQELLINGSDVFKGKPVELKVARSGFLVTEVKATEKWNLTTSTGAEIITDQDSIAFDGFYFAMLKDGKWSLYNRFGRKLSIKQFDEVRPSVLNAVPVRRGQYWGLLNFRGENQLGMKYDNIAEYGYKNQLPVKYLGEWGLIDLFGEWSILPKYDSLILGGEHFIGISGRAYYVLNDRNQRLYSSPDPLLTDDGYIAIRKADTLWGALNNQAKTIFQPKYQKVFRMERLFFAQDNQFLHGADSTGSSLLDDSDRIQAVNGYAEGFYRIIKDNKYGFIDHLGKLRIANRYDSARLFSESACAVQLLGNWGFVNKQESLIAQPIFQDVGDFDNGLCKVKLDGYWGIIDKEGEWVLRPQYEWIDHKKASGYILHGKNGKIGVANKEGYITLVEQYDNIVEVRNGLLIVTWKGKMGIMDQDGYERVPFQFDKIEVQGDYFIMRKLNDY